MKRFCLGLAIAAGAVLASWLFIGWNMAGPMEKPVSVVIEPGSSLAGAAKVLEHAGVLGSADSFRLRAKFLGRHAPIQAGEYAIPAHASQARVLTLLQSGRVLQRFIIIPEGLPSVLVRDKLLAAPALTGDVATPEEGSVLPDSYSYQRGENRAVVLERMQRAMVEELARLWSAREAGLAIISPREAIILASIVEKETGKASERAMIAGVYSNRLKAAMPLQADPTVIYPVTKGRPLGRRILRSELAADNGYNTYARAGLPQGPIANPGREAIRAVLHPAATDALYFVADGSGGHVFAKTLAEHKANVEKWYALRRARGEM